MGSWRCSWKRCSAQLLGDKQYFLGPVYCHTRYLRSSGSGRHGPRVWKWLGCRWQQKKKLHGEKGIEEQNRTRVVPVLSPVPFLPGSYHKRRSPPVAALHKRRYPEPHAPVITDGNGVLQFTACSILKWRRPHLKTIYDMEKGRYIITRVSR